MPDSCSSALRSLLIVTSLLPYSAAADGIDELFNMPIEQLLSVKIAVSSHFHQNIQQTPGVIHVIERSRIEQNGWQNLQQALLHIPGVQISVSKNGHSNLWLRGVQSRNNNKVLLLIDGVPQEDLYYGNFNLIGQLPMAMVEKIEVLRGPGGVVHGANSFAGVISVTTRDKGARLGLRIGTAESYQEKSETEQVIDYGFYLDHYLDTDMGQFYLFVDSYEDDGFQPEYNRKGQFYHRDASRSGHYLMAKYKYQALNVRFNYSDHQYPYRYTSSNRWQGYDKQLITLAADYQTQLNSKQDIKVSGFIKHYDFSRPKEFFDGDRLEADGRSLHNTSAAGLDTLLLSQLDETRHLTAGVAYRYDKARETVEDNTDYPVDGSATRVVEESLVEAASRELVGIFAEYQQALLSQHWLHIGLRYDYLSDFDDQWSYRLGLTSDKKSYYYKVLYGTAYRIPNYREYLKNTVKILIQKIHCCLNIWKP